MHLVVLTPSAPHRVALLQGAKPKKGLLHNKALWLVLGWVTAGALLFYVSAITAPHELFEPYDILGLDSSATEREIKSKYRNLVRVPRCATEASAPLQERASLATVCANGCIGSHLAATESHR